MGLTPDLWSMGLTPDLWSMDLTPDLWSMGLTSGKARLDAHNICYTELGPQVNIHIQTRI